MRYKIGVVLLLATAPFVMGAKLPEVPIHDFSSVAGTWKGPTMWRGATPWSEGMVMVIKEDGSYRDDNSARPSAGVMRITDGKLQYEGDYGLVVTVTLHEDNGKRILRGKRADKLRTFKLKPAKEKGKKEKE